MVSGAPSLVYVVEPRRLLPTLVEPRRVTAVSTSDLASDGSHVWVTNVGGNSVSELDASTGTLVKVP